MESGLLWETMFGRLAKVRCCQLSPDGHWPRARKALSSGSQGINDELFLRLGRSKVMIKGFSSDFHVIPLG